jgi:hypothetical protein
MMLMVLQERILILLKGIMYGLKRFYTNSTIGYSPWRDLTTFDFPYGSTNVEASTYIDATTNLFYMNNVMHDVWYQYGFDEASGNSKRIIMDLGSWE